MDESTFLLRKLSIIFWKKSIFAAYFYILFFSKGRGRLWTQ